MVELFTDDHILGSYYAAKKPHGGLLHREGVGKVVDTVLRKVGGDRVDVEGKVHKTFKETVGPEYLNPESVPLVGEFLAAGGQASIATIGDHGTGSEFYQEAKIEASNISGLVVDYLIKVKRKSVEEAQKILGKLHFDITSEDKPKKISEVMQRMSQDGVKTVYYGDDNEENIKEARSIASRYPFEYHEWVIKRDEDELGSLAAFEKFILKKLDERHDSGSSSGLIIDWDDTLTYEIRRMQKVRAEINKLFSG